MPVSYVVVAIDNTTGVAVETASGVVTLVTDLPWVSNPVSGVAVALTIRDWDALAYDARQTILDIAGRAFPIIISDVRASPTSTISLLTRNKTDLVALRALLATGDTILVRPVCSAVEGAYISAGSVTEERVKKTAMKWDDRQAGTDWRRVVTIAAKHVDQPPPKVGGFQDTLLTLSQYVPTTLADLATAFGPGATLLRIAQTQLGTF